jgi:CubicO group peptidase (beta-lactamase class C family)
MLQSSAMRLFPLCICVLVLTSGCSTSRPPQNPVVERLSADTPETTVEGNTFIAPAGWTLTVRKPATIVQTPEEDSRIALVDVHAKDADEAVAAAWNVYGTHKSWPLKIKTESPDKDGWSDIRTYTYQTSPDERRGVQAVAHRADGIWNVVIFDVAEATGEKRLGQFLLISDQLFPKGYTRESFAGKQALVLDAPRIAELSRFVETGLRELRIPGVALGLIQGGKVVFSDGFGVRDLDGHSKPDADTLFMIASDTKALTTLMLAKLVDEKKLAWDTPVTSLLPSFKLGNADTTKSVLVKHLVCACTGLPRQDLEWLLEFKGLTPGGALERLSAVQPTSKFGEMFQYSNQLAAAGGFVGGHVAFPTLEIGAAYDEAMRTRVFSPLGMTATTFDYARALNANHASPHAMDIDGKPAHAVMEENYSIVPFRPAGGAWSNIRDLLKYVAIELSEGMKPDGQRYISKENLFARRTAQVTIGKDLTYGMGLVVDQTYQVPVVSHDGSLFGFKSEMMLLPDQGVGAVMLTNSDAGSILLGNFQRKLLEVLFNGRPEADADLASQTKTFFEGLSVERKLLTAPADPADAGKLATLYKSAALGDIAVLRHDGSTIFDFGEFKSEVASRHNPDGTVSFITIVPGFRGLEFVMKNGDKPTLVTRDAQHEYVFTAQ